MLCILRCLLVEVILQECHNGGMISHFGKNKTFLGKRIFSRMDMGCGKTHQIMLDVSLDQDSRTKCEFISPLFVPKLQWMNVSMDFTMGLLQTQ